MVRNFKGGNKGKKGARKAVRAAPTNTIRYAKEDGEIYGRVQKVFGRGMFDVLCDDGVIRLLVVRKKFKGRNKRDNNVTINGIILVGKREWEITSKKEKVDLLFVYSENQIEILKIY